MMMKIDGTEDEERMVLKMYTSRDCASRSCFAESTWHVEGYQT